MPRFRVAVGGFIHETNTFPPTKAGLEALEHGGGWPGLSRGPALIEATRNVNTGICGYIGTFAGTVYAAHDGVRKSVAIAHTATKPLVH